MKRLALLVLILGLWAAPAAAEEAKAPVEIVDFGLYAAGQMRHTPAPDQLSGQQWTAPHIRLLERTDTIPGQLGRIFGFRFRVNDPKYFGKPLQLRILHPRLSAHTGRSGTETGRRDVATAAAPERGYFFAFEYTWEIAEGDWTFQVVHAGEVLAEKKFRVVVSMY
jgi:hypothetical protein